MQICFFNDESAINFNPLTLTRPVDDLRIGLCTIHEKWQHALSADNISRIVPDYLSEVFSKGNISEKEDCIWINSRYLPSDELLSKIQELPQNQFISHSNNVVAARVAGKLSADFHQQNKLIINDLKKIEIKEAKSIRYLWDLLSLNGNEIEYDLTTSELKTITDYEGKYDVKVLQGHNIFIGDDVEIEPGCVLIAKDGPIVLEKGVTIEAGSILKGPVAVCENATVKMASRIYNGTTIGPVCKVGGEVANCIFHSYSNKAHDGFTGNSVFGQWVNLGADTVTSNLKNNYSPVRIVDWNTQQTTDTGQQFLGTVMADHSKTAINTALNTGTFCGVSSNIFINKLTPKYIKSFTWLGADEPQIYRFEKAIEVMKAMMKRRDVDLSEGYKNMMMFVFDHR